MLWQPGFRRALTCVFALALSACVVDDTDEGGSGGSTGGSSATEGDTDAVDPDPIDPGDPDEPTNPDLYDGGTYWRIDLRSTLATGEVTVDGVQLVDIPAGQHDPVPALRGEYMAIAYAGEEVTAAVPLYFPSAGRVESLLEGGGMVLDVVEHDQSPATVFVPMNEDVDRVEIQDTQGAVAAQLQADALPTMGFRAYDNPVSAAYPNIEIIMPAESDRLPAKYYDGGYIETVVAPDDATYQTLLARLDQLSPALIASVSAIAIVDPPNDGCQGKDIPCGYNDDGTIKVNQHCADNGFAATNADGDPIPTSFLGGAAVGSFLVLNVHAAPWTGTVAHEVAHTFNNRLDLDSGPESQWPPDAVAKAQELLEDYNVGANLSGTWNTIHNSAVEWNPAGTYKPHDGDGWCSLDAAEVVPWGFATPYGSSNTADDIAEYVAKVVVDGASALACTQFAGQAGGDEFPEELTLAYAKLALLWQLGALTKEQFDACVQSVSVGRDEEGIELNDQVFTSDLKAGYYMDGDIRYFAILGQGVEDWQLLYEVTVPEGKSPLGVHRFGSISGLSIALLGLPPNGVYLNHPDTPRASDSGIILITEASTERVTGAVFHLTLQNALGQNTSHDPYAPFLIGSPP